MFTVRIFGLTMFEADRCTLLVDGMYFGEHRSLDCT